MAFIPVPNCVKVSLEWLIAGQRVVMTLSFRKAEAVTESDLEAVAGATKDWYDDHLKAHMNSGAVLDNVRVQDLTTETSPTFNLGPGLNDAASGSGAQAPLNAAVVASFHTGLRGRSFRGRAYVPGINVADIASAGAISGTLATNLATDFARIDAIESATGFEHVVISRFTGKAPRTTGIATTVTGVAVDTNIDSQRRRLFGRGR